MNEFGALLCHLARCRAVQYDISAVQHPVHEGTHKPQATGSDDHFQPVHRRVAKAPKGSERCKAYTFDPKVMLRMVSRSSRLG
jgi:hypothetical protein